MPWTFNPFVGKLDYYQASTSVSGLTPKTYNATGSSCTGLDGATNRVLTIDNAALSSNEGVYFNGQRLSITVDYTVNHIAASSTITFLGQIFNANQLIVTYFI